MVRRGKGWKAIERLREREHYMNKWLFALRYPKERGLFFRCASWKKYKKTMDSQARNCIMLRLGG